MYGLRSSTISGASPCAVLAIGSLYSAVFTLILCSAVSAHDAPGQGPTTGVTPLENRVLIGNIYNIIYMIKFYILSILGLELSIITLTFLVHILFSTEIAGEHAEEVCFHLCVWTPTSLSLPPPPHNPLTSLSLPNHGEKKKNLGQYIPHTN